MSATDRSQGTVQVLGARELRRALKAAGEDLSDLKAVNLAAAQVASRAAKGLVPSGPTGRLAASVRASGTTTAGIIRAGRKTVPYAPAVHWGRRYWPCKGHPRATPSPLAPTPFLSQGAQSTEATWGALYTARVNQIIDQIQGA